MKNLLFMLFCIAGISNPRFVHAAENENSDAWQYSFSGSHRTRFSSLDNQFRPGLDGGDQALSLRTLTRVQADRGQLSLVAEIQDSRNYLNDQGSALSTIEINTLEPLQLYVARRFLNTFQENSTLDVKAGMFTMNFGSQHLVARHGFRNTIQNYTGIQADWQSDSGKSLSTFWVMPNKIRPADRQGLLDNAIQLDKADSSLQLLGVFYKASLGQNGPDLETYLFSLQEEDKSGVSTADRELYIPGFRLLQAPAPDNWDYQLEASMQWGSRRSTAQSGDTNTLDVKASLVFASAGYSFSGSWQPNLAVDWSRASGDRNATDARFERFDGLFGPRREYGPTGIYGLLGRNNLQSLGLRLTFSPGSNTDAMIAIRNNHLVSATDSFASSGVRDISGASGKEAGTQFEFMVRHWLKPQILRLEAGGAFNRNGTFFEQAPNASREGHPAYVYADFTVFF